MRVPCNHLTNWRKGQATDGAKGASLHLMFVPYHFLGFKGDITERSHFSYVSSFYVSQMQKHSKQFPGLGMEDSFLSCIASVFLDYFSGYNLN